jgi:hypothetical protein
MLKGFVRQLHNSCWYPIIHTACIYVQKNARYAEHNKGTDTKHLGKHFSACALESRSGQLDRNFTKADATL